MYNLRSDEELLEALKKDSNRAFTAIYDRYWQKMLFVAKAKLSTIEEAEEVVQNIFVMLWHRRLELEIKGPLSHYLAVAVKYQVIKYLDRQHQQRKYLEHLSRQISIGQAPRDAFEARDMEEQLTFWVNELPEKCRLVYLLSREEGLPYKKIAARLAISEKTVEAHISKAIKFLRKKLVYVIYAFTSIAAILLEQLTS
jgi:RNA polymerase sigma-70 factor (family 1)